MICKECLDDGATEETESVAEYLEDEQEEEAVGSEEVWEERILDDDDA